MITLKTISEVLRRIEELKRKEGNCGRAYRRFLKQMFWGVNGKQTFLCVEFHGYGEKELSASEYALLCAYVEARTTLVRRNLIMDFSDLQVSCDVFDKMFNNIGASLELRKSVDIDTASLSTLRNIVSDLHKVVYQYFENYSEDDVNVFLAQHDLLLTHEEEQALSTRVAGFSVELTPRTEQLLKYFPEHRTSKSFLDEVFGKAA
jgi:hypothetical protein